MQISNQQVQSILKNYGINGAKKIGLSSPVYAPARQDKLELSPEAQEMNSVRQKIASLPDVRADRVNELKAQVQKGNYQVDSQDVAQKILERSLADRIIGKS
jgi:negative regulator of flagellin synthesis FlgM